jgi:hypothetical protein
VDESYAPNYNEIIQVSEITVKKTGPNFVKWRLDTSVMSFFHILIWCHPFHK